MGKKYTHPTLNTQKNVRQSFSGLWEMLLSHLRKVAFKPRVIDPICPECAECIGGILKKECYGDAWFDECVACEQERCVYASRDYNWPDRRLKK